WAGARSRSAGRGTPGDGRRRRRRRPAGRGRSVTAMRSWLAVLPESRPSGSRPPRGGGLETRPRRGGDALDGGQGPRPPSGRAAGRAGGLQTRPYDGSGAFLLGRYGTIAGFSAERTRSLNWRTSSS